MKYDNTKSLTQNAMAGVDITEPELPEEVDLTTRDNFRVPDELWNAINEYLSDEYGYCVNSYGLELKVSGIDWDTEE